ncbi:DUF5819 family protein [Streptomyces sp. NPDC087422]|uniref:DUF5819 family protein n=1 Tax=Streptomyces sp. NPDC087422 TaxID=3365786 RepID=UPI003821F7B3
MGIAIALIVATALTHVAMVFLHVAPANPISQRFGRQINAWIYPVFEQNWQLFAPDPESVDRTVYARVASTGPDGTMHVTAWVDLTAADTAAVEHDPFPSHTHQNMLRRAWSSYVDTHGSDDEPHSDRAVMTQRYLRNIAVQRVGARPPVGDGPVQSVQLRVVTVPVAVQHARPVATAATAADTRLLPWWKVPSNDH